MFLYHYFDKFAGPFVSLSDIPADEAKSLLLKIKETKPYTQSAQRHPGYVDDRHFYEEILRTEFIKKGGIIKRQTPHYMTLEHSPWLMGWFENSDFIKIPVEEFDLNTVSFTYGDSHPVFSPRKHKMDGREYRNKLYTYNEIIEVIKKYGLPQDWNNNGAFGPERYIEACVWSDETVGKYINQYKNIIEIR